MENTSTNIYEKSINLILLLMIFGVVLGFNLITYDSCFVKITILQIGATIAFAIWLMSLLAEKIKFGIKILYNKFKIFLSIPICVYFIWGIVSFLRSPYKGVGLEELIKLSSYVGIYFVVINNVREMQFKRIIYSLIITGVVAVLYGFVQYLGLDPFIWGGAFGNRVFSTFGNPNFFGAYLVAVAPLTLAIFLNNKKPIFLVFFVLISICIFLTKSKGAWLGFAGEMVIFSVLAIIFLSHARKKRIKMFLVFFPVFIILISVTGIVVLTKKRPDSIIFRLLTWRSTFEMIKLNPVTGNGLNSFRVIYPLYRHPEIFRIEGKHQTETQHPENEFIEIASDEGIIGLGIFIWMLMTIYIYAIKKIRKLKEQSDFLKNYKQNKKTQNILFNTEYKLSVLVGLIVGLGGLLIHNLFGVNMRFVSSGLFFWMFIGLINLQVIGYSSVFSSRNNNLSRKGYVKYIKPLLNLFIICTTIYLVIIFIRFYLADIHHNKGITYSKTKLWDKALKEYQKVIDYNPYFTMAHYFVGNVYNDRWKEGDPQRALEKYKDVKKLAPNYVMVHYQEGTVYDKLGEWNNAIEDYKKALGLDPVFAPTYFRIGWAYTQIEQWDKALENFREATKIQPNFFDAYINLGNLNFLLKDFQASEEAFKKAKQINPKSITVYRNLGLLYANLRKFDEASGEWQRALEIEPGNLEIKNLLDRLPIKK